MRVMISQPMKGLTLKQIERSRAETARLLEAEGHTVVDSIVTDSPPADGTRHCSVWGSRFRSWRRMTQCCFWKAGRM